VSVHSLTAAFFLAAAEARPESDGVRSVTMRAEELAMLVNGLDVKQTTPRKWYRKSA
jgi:hypothetical protein